MANTHAWQAAWSLGQHLYEAGSDDLDEREPMCGFGGKSRAYQLTAAAKTIGSVHQTEMVGTLALTNVE
jgi:hypothetical protein